MATAKKRWPNYAEQARVESVALACDISTQGDKAKQALRTGARDLTLYHIAEIQRAAELIRFWLVTAKGEN